MAGFITGGILAATGGVVASVIGARAMSSASERAAGAQQAGLDRAIQEQMRQFDSLQKNLAPYMRAGNAALGEYMDLLGMGEDRQILQYQGRDATAQQIANYQQGVGGPMARNMGAQISGYVNDPTDPNSAAYKENEAVAARVRTYREQGLINDKNEWTGSMGQANLADNVGADLQNLQNFEQHRSGVAIQKAKSDMDRIIANAGDAAKLGGRPEDFTQRTSTGAERERAQIEAIKSSGQYQEMVRSGEEGLLQNAAATGGLRGGNTQASLGRLRPQVLNQLIEQRLNRLAGLSQMGQASAAGVGAAGMQSANSISQLYAGQGDARAQAELAGAGAWNQVAGGITGALSGIGGNLIGRGMSQQPAPPPPPTQYREPPPWRK